MAKQVTTPAEDFGFVPDVDDSKQFDFQVDAEPIDDFGFVPDDIVIPDPNVVDFKVDKSFKVAEEERFSQVDFTNDVLSMPELEDFELTDPGEPPTGEFKEDKIGFKEAFIDKLGRKRELLPFVGPLYSVSRMGKLIESAQRIQDSPEPPKRGGKFGLEESPSQFAGRQVEWMRDRYVVAEWVNELNERQERGVSIGGKIAEGILELPAFIVEFVATAGVYEGAAQGTKIAIAKIIKRSGQKISKELAEKITKSTGIKIATKLTGALVGTAARTTVQATRVLKSSVEKLMPNVQVTEKGEVVLQESGETPFSAIAKGFGDVFIENLTEVSGGAIGKVAAKIPFVGKFKSQLENLFLKLNPSKTSVDFIKTVGTKIGYNGFLEEIGEEQLGKVLRLATGVSDFPEKLDGESNADYTARLVTSFGEDLLVEAGILAPLAALGAAGKVASVRTKGPSVKDAKPKKVSALKDFNKEPIDRTADNAIGETQNRLALVKSSPKETQTKISEEAVTKVKEQISFKKPKIPIMDKLKNLALTADKNFRDEFAGLRKAVRAADPESKLTPAKDPVQLAVAFTQKSSAKARGFVMEATTDLAGNRKSKSLKKIFKPIVGDGGKKNVEDFVTYLVSARDINLQKQNIETGIDPVASQLAFESLDSPEFAQAAREVTEWNTKGIDLLVESGRITQESGDAIKKANPVYVPFFREFGTEPGVKKGKGGKFVPKKIKGSQRKIVDPIEGMMQQMEAMISSAQKASIERSIADLATENPEALEDFIVPLKTPIAPIQFSAEEIKSQLQDMGVSFEGVKDSDLGELLTVFRPSKTIQQQGVVKLTVEGKDKFFKMESDLLDVLEGTDNYKLGPFWDIVLGKPTRALKLGATGLNASFGLIRNPARDIQTFNVTSEFAKAGPFTAINGILKDVKTKASGIAENFGFESIKGDSDVQKFSALGGEMSGFISQDRGGTKHLQHDMLASNGIRYTIKTFKDPIDTLRALVGVTEVGVRVGEFSAALKEGESIYGKGSLSASVFALNAAQDVTTNFTRHGQIGKQINQVIPFFNVAIQGPDKIVRSFKERPLKSTVAAISSLTVPAIFFWWRNKDKPWYQNMTAHEKSNYMHFELPDDERTVVRWPVPFELGHIFQAMPVAFLDAVYRDRPEEISEILEATLRTSNPFDWPSLIGPVIDIESNEDFAGRPIVSRANEGKLAKDQFGPNTTELMKVIGKQINMSPSQLEHLANSYSGGLYNRTARMLKSGDVEKQPADLPIIGTLFARDSFAPRKQVEDFYKERELLNKKFNSKDITLKEAFRRVAMNNLATVMNVSFDRLRESKTTEEKKAIWRDIQDIVELTDRVTPKEN